MEFAYIFGLLIASIIDPLTFGVALIVKYLAHQYQQPKIVLFSVIGYLIIAGIIAFTIRSDAPPHLLTVVVGGAGTMIWTFVCVSIKRIIGKENAPPSA